MGFVNAFARRSSCRETFLTEAFGLAADSCSTGSIAGDRGHAPTGGDGRAAIATFEAARTSTIPSKASTLSRRPLTTERVS